jgi:hypothetical protein
MCLCVSQCVCVNLDPTIGIRKCAFKGCHVSSVWLNLSCRDIVNNELGGVLRFVIHCFVISFIVCFQLLEIQVTEFS